MLWLLKTLFWVLQVILEWRHSEVIHILNILDPESSGEVTDLVQLGFSATPISFAQKVTEWKKLFPDLTRGNREGVNPTFKGLWSSTSSITCP